MLLPKHIREHFARALGYTQRQDIPQALESLALALRDVISLQNGQQRKDFARQINTFLRRVISHPQVLSLLNAQDVPPQFTYKDGKERALIVVLREFAQMLRHMSPEASQHVRTQNMQRKERLQSLLDKGQQAIERGEMGMGRGFLERAAAEYADKGPILEHIGHILFEANIFHSAGTVYMKAVEVTPKNMENYTKAIDAFIIAEEYAKAERVFRLALRHFGGHPRTYARMAHMYYLWKNFDKAKEYALHALELDAEEMQAHNVLETLKFEERDGE